MNKKTRHKIKLLSHRRWYITAMILATVFFLGAFNVGSWYFVKRMEHYLDDELGKRLNTAAELTAELLARDIRDPLAEEDRTFAALTLGRVQKTHDLQGIFLVDDNYTILASSELLFEFGETVSYWRDDSLYFFRAWQGQASIAPLHVLEGNRFKTAYAPVLDAYGEPSSVLVLEANADFFELLEVFHRGRFIGLLASLGLLLVLAIFLYWAITLFLRTEASLRQAERLAAMGQMAATVAHEIRNPLGIIKSSADVLQKKYDSQKSPDELFEFIPQEIRRLNRLVNDFLLLSREPSLNPDMNDIKETVEKAVLALSPDFNTAGITLGSYIDTDIPSFKFDKDAVHQILLNILLNALHATEPGGAVNVAAKKVNVKSRSFVKLQITDTGSGIEGDPRRIFEPFYTTKASGSGLGMAVAKKQVEAHHGWIEMASKKGEGTTVTFYIPL